MATSKMIFEKAIGVCKPNFTEKSYQTSEKPYKRCHQGPLNALEQHSYILHKLGQQHENQRKNLLLPNPRETSYFLKITRPNIDIIFDQRRQNKL